MITSSNELFKKEEIDDILLTWLVSLYNKYEIIL